MSSTEAARVAVRQGDVDALRALLSEEPTLVHATTVDNKRTLLHTLADYPSHTPRQTDIAKLLIDAGADVNARIPHAKVAHSRETPLHWAASNDDVRLTEILLDAGAEIDSDGGVILAATPLWNAVIFRCVNVANLLIDRGAAVNLMIAAGAGRRDLVAKYFDDDGNVVEDAGALPCWKETRDAESALNSAFGFACRNGHLTVAKELLERDADPTVKNPAGDTPLKQAQDGAHRIIVSWLKERGIEA